MSFSIRLAAALLLAWPVSVAAAPTPDAQGDFIASYTGPLAGDLDVLSSAVTLRSGRFELAATFDAPIGTTPGALYVFGFNRGAGTANFGAIAPGVLFDSVAIVAGNGTGFVRDLLLGIVTPIDPSAIQFDGASLFASFSGALLPGTGLEPSAYTYNLWPRSPGNGIATISDFAPDNSNASVAAVPEPASWAMLIAGFGLVGAMARRRPARHGAIHMSS